MEKGAVEMNYPSFDIWCWNDLWNYFYYRLQSNNEKEFEEIRGKQKKKNISDDRILKKSFFSDWMLKWNCQKYCKTWIAMCSKESKLYSFKFEGNYTNFKFIFSYKWAQQATKTNNL